MPLIRPAVLMHRDTDERVTLTSCAALERFFDNCDPSDWMRIA